MSYPGAPTIHVVQRVFLTLLKEQRFADAEALLKQFRDWHPNEATAYYQAETMLASAMKDEKRAKEFATKWLLLAPGSASARGTLEEYGVDISTIIPTVVVPVKVLATYIGQYRASNMALDIAQQGDKLYATTDDGRFELRAKGTDQSSTTFYFVGVPFEGRFLSTKSGELTLQLMRGNTTYVLNKVK
jgi:hypothetical protein